MKISKLDRFYVFSLSGCIRWTEARCLEKEVEKLVKRDEVNFIFDLERVKLICSGGIGAIVYGMKLANSKRGEAYLVSADCIDYTLKTIGLDVVFENCYFRSFEELKRELKI